MKKPYLTIISIFITLFLIFSSFAYSQNSDSGLIVYYPFNKNANDESGNNNNGILQNSVKFTDGISGNGVFLQGKCEENNYCTGGTGGYITLPLLKLEKKMNFAVNIWVKEEVMLMVHGEAYIIFGDHTNGCISIGHWGDKLGFTVFENGVNIDYDKKDKNNFIMLTLVYDKGNLSAYKNGELLETNYKAPVTDKKINQSTIGKHTWNNNNLSSTRFSGVIDEVRIYNRSLSKEEIKRLYDRIQNPINDITNEGINQKFIDAQKAFSDGKYLLVLELLKDFPLDDPSYSEAVILMNQALAKIPDNSTQSFVTVSGNINCGCSKAVSGYVVFEDMNTKLSVGKCRIISDGYYCMILPSGKIYSYYIDSKDFYPVSRVIDFSSTKQPPNYKDDIRIVTYEQMKEQQVSIRINNIFFDFNESKLKSESYLELDRMYKFLNDNPYIKVEISGYTDNVGSDEYNMTLSYARANAVKDYLVSKGINSNRITAKGYGKSNPVSTNDTDEGRQLNRRVEFKIIK